MIELWSFSCFVFIKSRYSDVVQVKKDVGNVDILVNNAGIVTGKKYLQCPDSLIIKTMEVNAMAHFWVSLVFFTWPVHTCSKSKLMWYPEHLYRHLSWVFTGLLFNAILKNYKAAYKVEYLLYNWLLSYLPTSDLRERQHELEWREQRLYKGEAPMSFCCTKGSNHWATEPFVTKYLECCLRCSK